MKQMLNVTAVVLALGLTACGSGSDDNASGGDEQHAVSVAEQAAEAVPGATVIEVNEENDPNDMLGRPNGYTEAAIVKMPGQPCPQNDLGVECGATVELWAESEEAEERADYIQTILGEAEMLGTEYTWIVGDALVRVSGGIPPTKAHKVRDAVGAEGDGGSPG